MARFSKRLRKLLKNGGTPFSCPNCPRVFASDKDRAHHLNDSHNPDRPAKEPTVSRHHQHQHQNNVHNLNQRQPQDATAKDFTSLFQKKSKSDELFVVDFATPLDKIPCKKPKCKSAAIPLTGFCIEHDPLCACITLARRQKAEDDAADEKEAEKAKGPLVLFGSPHAHHGYPDERDTMGYGPGDTGYHSGTMYERLMH